MRASVRDHGDEIRFVVEDADAKTAALLRAQFYAEADGRFEKRFRHSDLLFARDFRAIEARGRLDRVALIRAATGRAGGDGGG